MRTANECLRLVAETERLFMAVHMEFVQAGIRGDTQRRARLDRAEEMIVNRMERRVGAWRAAQAVTP